MAKQPESKVVNAITQYVSECGGYSFKIHGGPFQRSGEPDLLGWLPTEDGPIPFAVEVKLPGERPRPLQNYRLRQWAKGGFAAGFATSVEDFQKIIEGEAHG